ncbi:MAG: dipeptidase [Planctomycetota bacterium]
MRIILALTTLLAAASAQESTAAAHATAADAVRTRALAIHERVITLDTHKDIAPLFTPAELPSDPQKRELFRQKYDPAVRGEQQVDFPKMREGLYDTAFFIVYVGQGALNPSSFQRAYKAAITKFDAIHRMTERYPEDIELARSPADVLRIAGAGKLVACIGIENGYPMGEDLGRIAEFHERGARYMSIAHNRHSQLGDSHTPEEPMHGGLSDLGRQAVDELNRVGIMIDISHAAKPTMLQVLEQSGAPVVASHSGCRAVCDHSRNLDDEQLRALRDNGGVIQCVALGSFVAADREQADVAAFVDHIDHVVQTIGIEHVGISSDFDGGGGIPGWNDASETFNVTLELVRRGYTEEQIGKIWSGNLLRVWADVERVATELQARDADRGK